MGIPVRKFICASNVNNVLSDFIRTGVYDKRRELRLTISPSMDILISSNLERLVYDLGGRDPARLRVLIEDLDRHHPGDHAAVAGYLDWLSPRNEIQHGGKAVLRLSDR